MDQPADEVFNTRGTIGIEEEFYIVDEAGKPVSGTDELVYKSSPPKILENRLDHELFKCVIETQTPVIDSPTAIEDTLQSVRGALLEHAQNHGYGIAVAGLHPEAKWRSLEHADKPRYREQLDRIQYPQHRNLTAGLHIHVGVDDGDGAVWVANELRRFLPPVLALSANSPFWCGFDTGLASARAKIFEALPNTGMPGRFASLAAYRKFERSMVKTDSINDRGELWFDVRPHTELGTVEVRTPDAQLDIEWVAAFTRHIRALVIDLLERFEDGEAGTDIRREILDENKWRAMRYGRSASFLTIDGTEKRPLSTVIHETMERIDSTALEPVLEGPSGAQRAREIHQREGMDGLCRSLQMRVDR